MQRTVKVFFYGSFMDPKILSKNRLHPKKLTAAYLRDWVIGFTPYATIFPKKGSGVWGISCLLSSPDLDRVYSRPLFKHHRYYPEPVVVWEAQRSRSPALVYISYQPVGVKPDRSYLKTLLRIAQHRKFSNEYIKQLKEIL